MHPNPVFHAASARGNLDLARARLGAARQVGGGIGLELAALAGLMGGDSPQK